jgi:rhodanese-related sulfurtransferase/molybdopterin synthase catalytic subunit
MFHFTSESICQESTDCPGCVRVCMEDRIRSKRFDRQIKTAILEPEGEDEGRHIVEEAICLSGIDSAKVMHRTGEMKPGHTAILIEVSGKERCACLDALSCIHTGLLRRMPTRARIFYEDGGEEHVLSSDLWNAAHREGGAPIKTEICWAAQSLKDIEGYRLIDVREPDELEEEPLVGLKAEHVRFDDFCCDHVCTDQSVLLVCRTGMRSYRLAAEVRRKGKHNVWSLQGGLVRLRILSAQNQPL